MVKAGGASMLRGGAFKPRTSPFAFKGLGVAGAGDPRRGARGDRAADRHRVPGHHPRVRRSPSTRTSSRSARATCRTTRCSRSRASSASRCCSSAGSSSSLDELLMAADYVLKEGNERVMLCERGIRTFETATRFTLDLSAVPWLKLHSHLPVIVDPSHASGDRRLVEPLARAAAAVGADGIIVEVHQDPAAALCDGPQALYGRDFAEFAVARRRPREPRRPRDRLTAAGQVGVDQRADRDAARRASSNAFGSIALDRDRDRERDHRDEVEEQRGVGGPDPAHALVPGEHGDHGAGGDDVERLPPDGADVGRRRQLLEADGDRDRGGGEDRERAERRRSAPCSAAARTPRSGARRACRRSTTRSRSAPAARRRGPRRAGACWACRA